MFKKGAMFGLDARIALAIFGALSVISGAALYSAIQESKMVAFVTELEEVGKATTAYLLDTGQEVAKSHAYYLEIGELIDSSVPGANTPYVSYDGTLPNSRIHPKFGSIYLSEFQKDDWGGTAAANLATGYCEASDPANCYIHVGINGFTLADMQKYDDYIDNADGGGTGKFRWTESSGNYHFHYRVRSSERLK